MLLAQFKKAVVKSVFEPKVVLMNYVCSQTGNVTESIHRTQGFLLGILTKKCLVVFQRFSAALTDSIFNHKGYNEVVFFV